MISHLAIKEFNPWIGLILSKFKLNWGFELLGPDR